MNAFDKTGLATAHTAAPVAAPVAISHIDTSLHCSNIGCTHPNQAPTIPERIASCGSHFAPAKYPHPIGDIARATSGAYVPALNAEL